MTVPDEFVAPDKHAVIVGPIRKEFTLSDGTVVDTRPDVVMLDSPEQAAELAHLIGQHFETYGHPHHDYDEPFKYVQTTTQEG